MKTQRLSIFYTGLSLAVMMLSGRIISSPHHGAVTWVQTAQTDNPNQKIEPGDSAFHYPKMPDSNDHEFQEFHPSDSNLKEDQKELRWGSGESSLPPANGGGPNPTDPGGPEHTHKTE